MRLAHLILAHHSPKQLERLITRLQHPDADIYIHLDKKSEVELFDYLREYQGVYFIEKRIRVDWGTHTVVEATLIGFTEILNTGKNYQYINLLSGEDYPLKSVDYIHRFLDHNPGIAFMNYRLFETDWLEAQSRVQKYHFNTFKFPGKFIIQDQVNKIFPQRKFPNNMTLVGRSQWFTIPLACVNYLINYWNNNKELRKFIKLTWGPDEFIFQTILYNSDYKNIMTNKDLRYIDWSAGGTSPKYLTMEDADELLSSDALFARKFDMKLNSGLLDLIDRLPTNNQDEATI